MMRQRKWLLNKWMLSLIGLLIVSLSQAQENILPDYPLKMQAQPDTLILPDSCEAWRRLYRELDSLRARQDTVISIVHLGDSHIQAGHYSGKVMRLLQAVFGNAGRGWIAPLRLSRTNEPDDYFIKSVATDWIAGRCIQHNKKTPIGIGGIGVKSLSSSINLDVIVTPKNGAGYAFNKAILYRGSKSMPMLPAGHLKDSIQTLWADSVRVPGVLADTFQISRLTDTLQLHSTRREEGANTLLPASSFSNIYYGFTLTNGNPGILYHSIGVNGAMFVNYTDEAYWRQVALLKPSLLIISLGTNETFGRRFNTAEFSGQIKRFLTIVKHTFPQTAILLTTPPECYKRVWVNKKRSYARNSNTEGAAQAIRQVAKQEGVACFDLFTITGGKDSCLKWRNNRLLGPDRIHFRKEGYQEQGILLFRALMDSYNQH